MPRRRLRPPAPRDGITSGAHFWAFRYTSEVFAFCFRTQGGIFHKTVAQSRAIVKITIKSALACQGIDYVLYRFCRLNVAAGAADASRAMLSTSCHKVALLTAIFAF